jgi:hypothetical protein
MLVKAHIQNDEYAAKLIHMPQFSFSIKQDGQVFFRGYYSWYCWSPSLGWQSWEDRHCEQDLPDDRVRLMKPGESITITI